MNNFELVTSLFKPRIENAVKDLELHPDLWGLRNWRKDTYAHAGMTDIWVRYNDIKNLGPNFNDEHESVWYPEVDLLPNIKGISIALMAMMSGTRLGGILITKLAPGGRIEPHIDKGWHAEYYEKYYVPLQNDPGSVFCWEGETMDARPGQVFRFRNDTLHWVQNSSKRDRIALIICMRRT